MSECIYCGGNGCPYCMPVTLLRESYYVFDESIDDFRQCSEEEYQQADENNRLKAYI